MNNREGKKHKAKFLDLKTYSVRLYNAKGKNIKKINTEEDGKWLISAKVTELKNNMLVLAAFYCKSKIKDGIDGIIVQNINPNDGTTINSSAKDVNFSNLDGTMAVSAAELKDETKEDRVERQRFEQLKASQEGFSKYFKFDKFIYTPDNGIVILAENLQVDTYTTMNTNFGIGGNTNTPTTTTNTIRSYGCGSIMMIKVNASQKVEWVHLLPKSQIEEHIIGSTSVGGNAANAGGTYFAGLYNFPFYIGYSAFILSGTNNICLLFNDHTKNVNVLQDGQKPRIAYTPKQTDCFLVTLNAITGTYTRKSIFDYKDKPIAMMRLGVTIGNDFYAISKTDRVLAKSKISLGKIALQ